MSTRLAAIHDRLRVAAAVCRRVLGVPDYDAYAAHLKAFHPGCAVPTREQFVAEQLALRYSRPGAKCC